MSTVSTANGVHYTDHDGDELTVEPTGPGRAVFVVHDHRGGPAHAAVVLSAAQVHVLRDQLTEVLDEQAGQPFPARVGRVACPGCTGDPSTHPGGSITVTSEAEVAVYGDREDDYGTPRENGTRIAILWTALLTHKLADGAHLEPEDVGRLMLAMKLARDVHGAKRDNRVDMAGYALWLDRLETGR